MLIRALIGVAVALAAVACSSDVTVFGVPSGPSDTGGSGGSASSSQTGGDMQGPIAVSVSAVSSGGGTVTTSAGPSTGSGMDPKLECGGALCPVGGDNACCWDLKQFYGQPQAECVNGPYNNDSCRTEHTDAGVETRIECQLPSHCGAGEVCCGWRLSQQQVGTWYGETACKSECDWPDIELCDEMYDCPTLDTNNGPVKLECKQSSLLPTGYKVCGIPDNG